MDAKELRIGNWLNGPYLEPFQVTQIEAKALQGLSHWLRDSEPILLSPEILEKAGFMANEEKTEYGIGMPLGSGTDLIIEDMFSNFELPLDICLTTDKRDAVPKNFVYLKPIKYLHQLQNLYHSLTGQELEIKL